MTPKSIRGELIGVDTDSHGQCYVRLHVRLEDARELMDAQAFGRPVLVVHPAPSSTVADMPETVRGPR